MSAAAFLHGTPPPLAGDHAVRLLHAMPEWQRAVPAGELPLASRALVAPVATLASGVLDPVAIAPSQSRPPLGIVVDGVLLKNTSLGGRVVTEVIGEGDLIDAADEIEPSMLRTTTEYVVHRPVTVAFLGDRFNAAARRWPALRAVVDDQLARQRRRASAHLAILQLPRVEDRIVAAFTLFADRWGRVTPDGIVVGLPLTHEIVGQVVGARRPTVSLALAVLGEGGLLARRTDGNWVLARSTVTGA